MEIKAICGDGSIVVTNHVSALAVGTCGQGEINCTYWQLLAAFGEPDEGDGYKTQAEWTVLTPAGVATIYDWKQGKCYHSEDDGIPVEQITEWSIGGQNKGVVEWINKALAKNPMKLYARTISERDSRAGNKGGNEFVRVELSAFGKIIGYVELEITDDADARPAQYLLKFSPSQDAADWVILKEGHQKEGVIQSIKA